MDLQEIAARLREVDELYEQRMGSKPHMCASLNIGNAYGYDVPYARAWIHCANFDDLIIAKGDTITKAIDALAAQIAAVPTPDEANAARIAALKAELAKLEGN